MDLLEILIRGIQSLLGNPKGEGRFETGQNFVAGVLVAALFGGGLLALVWAAFA
jgi:hypothetical protein